MSGLRAPLVSATGVARVAERLEARKVAELEERGARARPEVEARPPFGQPAAEHAEIGRLVGVADLAAGPEADDVLGDQDLGGLEQAPAVVDLVLLEEAVADRVALGLEER